MTHKSVQSQKVLGTLGGKKGCSNALSKFADKLGAEMIIRSEGRCRLIRVSKACDVDVSLLSVSFSVFWNLLSGVLLFFSKAQRNKSPTAQKHAVSERCGRVGEAAGICLMISVFRGKWHKKAWTCAAFMQQKWQSRSFSKNMWNRSRPLSVNKQISASATDPDV